MEMFFRFLKNNQLTLSFIGSGFLLGSGFIYTLLWPLGLLGITLFLFSITKCTSLKQAALGGWIALTVKALCSLFFFWSSVPSLLINFPLGSSEPFIIAFYWLTISTSLGVAGVFLGGGLWSLFRFTIKYIWFLITPFVWLGTEVIGSLTYALFVAGQGSSLSPVFSLGYVGYLLAEHPLLLQAANFGGVYALSLLAVALASLLLYLLLRSTARGEIKLALACGFAVALSLSAYLPWLTSEEGGDNFRVTIVDTRFGDALFYARENKEQYQRSQLEEALRAALSVGNQYVLLSEGSRLTGTETNAAEAYKWFRFWYQDPSAVVIETGVYRNEDGERQVRTVVYDGVIKVGHAIDKHYLVPQGEYMPYFFGTAIQLVAPEVLQEKMKNHLTFAPAEVASQGNLPSHVPGILFCFSQKDALSVRTLTKERNVPFVVHPISHAWFHRPDSMWRQYDAMLKVHAVWSGVAIVSAGNMTQGFLYLPNGRKITPTVLEIGESWTVSQVAW